MIRRGGWRKRKTMLEDATDVNALITDLRWKEPNAKNQKWLGEQKPSDQNSLQGGAIVQDDGKEFTARAIEPVDVDAIEPRPAPPSRWKLGNY